MSGPPERGALLWPLAPPYGALVQTGIDLRGTAVPTGAFHVGEELNHVENRRNMQGE